ncbi:hypothetical protein A2U01_0110899, partial [Trifolium medium]|nr:hypothetical protein [Trifolium medium]
MVEADSQDDIIVVGGTSSPQNEE